jgi:diguanylate cyclase (GGDEF)-like protein
MIFSESASSTSSALRLSVRLGIITVVAYLGVDLAVEEGIGELPMPAELALEAVLLTPLTGVLGWLLVVAPLRRIADRELSRQRFEQRLHRALDMADSEADCHEVLATAMQEVLPAVPAELLLADSSDAHLKQVLPGRGTEVPACGVVSPESCPAIRRGQVQLFADSRSLDACPHLRRSDSATTATCAPVNVAGKTIGVLHLPGHRDAKMNGAIEGAASQVGGRLGMLRVMERAHLQAATDPLTGLLNRRSIEDRARVLTQAGIDFAVAFADLDHFKALNDVHGHDTGDRALRVFSRTCTKVMRETDSVARFGGEEFVFLLPGISDVDANDALARIQSELALTVARAGLPAFTVSFGLAHSSQADDFLSLLRLADEALLVAKRTGRDRIVHAASTSHPDERNRRVPSPGAGGDLAEVAALWEPVSQD